MKTGKLLYKIFLSLCYIVSAACFFFPFFKVTFSSSFGSVNADIIAEYILGEDFSKYLSVSPVDVIKLCLDSPDFIDANKLLIEAAFFFVIPFLLALAGAAVILAVKRARSAGLIAGTAGFVGALMNILMRVSLSANKSDIYGASISLSNFLSTELAANICLAMFIVSAIASVLMMLLFKDEENADSSIPAFDYSQNNGNTVSDNGNFAYNNDGYADDFRVFNNNNSYAGDNGNYDYNNGGYTDNNGNYDYNNGGFISSNGMVEDDKATERVPENLLPKFGIEDSQTVRLDGGIAQKTGMLECSNGMYCGMKFPVNVGEEIIIGRDASQSHIVLDNKYVYVSKKHCGILYEPGERYRVRVYSSNGIFVNGKERYEQGAEIYLYAGSVISVGNKENSFILR